MKSMILRDPKFQSNGTSSEYSYSKELSIFSICWVALEYILTFSGFHKPSLRIWDLLMYATSLFHHILFYLQVLKVKALSITLSCKDSNLWQEISLKLDLAEK